jgi:hypothetical protein
MAADHCGPSLAILVSLAQIDDIRCVSYNKKKGKKMPERCNNNVPKDDFALRVKSVKRLGRLISYDSDIAKWIYSDVAAVQAKLEEVSRWMFCKNTNHRENSSSIYERWVEELGDPTPIETKSDRNHLALNDRLTEDQIRQMLGIDHLERPRCLSRTPRCRNPISSKNKTRAADIVGQLASAWSVTQDMELSLLDLAHLLLCQGFHQSQAHTIHEDWIRQMKELLLPKEVTAHPSSTPNRHRTAVAESETPDSILSSGGSPSISIGTITPATTPIDRIGRTNISEAASPLSAKHMKEAAAESTSANIIKQEGVEAQESHRYLQHNRITRRTVRERILGYLSPQPPTFEQYNPKTTEMITVMLRKKLEADITPSERKDGYIYGYRRPSSSTHIKIGVTIDVEDRMKKWSSQCKYQPEVVFTLLVPHAEKVERLIHICLHQERKREHPGACNSGNGCPRGHIEWFEVALSRLKDVAAAWQRWIEMKPYDEKGSLKQVWRTRFKSVASSGLPDSWRQWIDFMPVKVELRNEIKLDIKVKSISGLSTEDKKDPTLNVEVKSGVVITETEIKVEPDEDDNAIRRRDVSAMSRQYKQRLQRLQDAVGG